MMISGMGLAQNATNETDVQNQSEEEIETVIIASSDSHIDPVVADAASDRIGAPVLLTDPGNLSDSTRQVLEDYNVERAAIIGGEVAFPPETEQEISSIVGETERIAGETATDTSLEIAEFFWPDGTDEAVMVQAPLMTEQENTFEMLSASANIEDERPIIPLDMNNFDNETAAQVEDLGINDAEVYSLQMNNQSPDDADNTTGDDMPNITSPDTSNETMNDSNDSNLSDRLQESGISAEVNRGSLDQLTSEIYNQMQEDVQNNELYAVTGANFSYGIPTYADPEGATYIVDNEMVQEDLEFLQNSSFESVTAIGEQDTGNQIVNQLDTAEDFIEVQESSDAAATIFQENSQEWSSNQGTIVDLPFDQEQDQNQTEDNQTAQEDQEDNQTNNQTESMNETSSSIEITRSQDAVTGEATYTSDESYEMVQRINQNQSDVSFVFELVPSDEATEGENEYEFEQQLLLQEGEYQVQAQLIVNGETIEEETETVNIQ